MAEAVDPLAAIPPEMCVQCKAARSLCGINPCPLLQRVRSHLPKVQVKGRDLWGSSPPSLFVGRHGYPSVGVGPMLPPEHLPDEKAAYLDSPGRWMDELTIPDVVGLRSSLVRTHHKAKVDAPALGADRITHLSQELAVAARPVDTEVRLTKVPSWSTSHVGDFTAPHGPSVEVERAALGENVRVERRMEAVTSDTDLSAAEGIGDLYANGTDPYQLERVFSAGMLGIGRRRRLVPTRWSITATDDIIGKRLIDELRDLPTIDKPVVHQGGGFGNRFLVLLLPRLWGFDNLEAWHKGAFWVRDSGPVVPAEDWEDHRSRTTYASNTTGGYYATRVAVAEHLAKTLRRQATVVALREITAEYTTPLGVWVVREACRRALKAPGLVFEDTAAALRHMDRHALTKDWRHHATLLAQMQHQSTLTSWSK